VIWLVVFLLTALVVLTVGIVSGLLMSIKNVRRASTSSQESLRRTVEQAEWQLSQMTRAAFEAMTAAARQASRSNRRE
jgi:uncharacterized membrane protein